MQRPTNPKVGDKFRVMKEIGLLKVGEIFSLKEDADRCPYFWNEDGSEYYSIFWSNLEPHTKSVRDAQVDDIVIEKINGFEHMVFERGERTVLLSCGNNFKNSMGNYPFDRLEQYYTLKAEPEVVDDKTAEAMKLLKEAGYKIIKE